MTLFLQPQSLANEYTSTKVKHLQNLKYCETRCKAGVDNKCLPVSSSSSSRKVSKPILAIAESAFYTSVVSACDKNIYTFKNSVKFEDNSFGCEKSSDFPSSYYVVYKSFLPKNFEGGIEHSKEAKVIYFKKHNAPSFTVTVNEEYLTSVFGGTVAAMSVSENKVFWTTHEDNGCFRSGF